MGLGTSHGCWHGSYSAFNRWRHGIAEAADIDLDRMEGYGPQGVIPWETLGEDVLVVLLDHSDCDGEIPARVCRPLADRLEQLLPLVEGNEGGGHIRSWRDKTQAFIDGLRCAADAGEPVEFY